MKDADPAMTEKAAFPAVFGVPYAKTTACKYKKIWSDAAQDLKNTYIGFGRTTEGLWKSFDKALRLKASQMTSNGHSSHTHPPDKPLPSQLRKQHSGTPEIEDISSESDSSTDEEDRITITGPHIQCPFCDQPMDANQSDQLIKMRAELESKTWPDPLPGNPSHRKAESFVVFSLHCERHRFESDHLPRARREGWPMIIDFSQLYNRILRLRPRLLRLLGNIDHSEFFLALKKRYAPGPSHLQGGHNEYNSFQEYGAG